MTTMYSLFILYINLTKTMNICYLYPFIYFKSYLYHSFWYVLKFSDILYYSLIYNKPNTSCPPIQSLLIVQCMLLRAVAIKCMLKWLHAAVHQLLCWRYWQTGNGTEGQCGGVPSSFTTDLCVLVVLHKLCIIGSLWLFLLF